MLTYIFLGGLLALFNNVVVANVNDHDLCWVFIKEHNLVRQVLVECKAWNTCVLEVISIGKFRNFLEHWQELSWTKFEVSRP